MNQTGTKITSMNKSSNESNVVMKLLKTRMRADCKHYQNTLLQITG